jgi:Flp pilus assembly protein TadG
MDRLPRRTGRPGRWRRSERGAAAVETAIVLPILLLLCFGIIDFGRALDAKIQLTQAAREGARVAALPVSIHPGVNASTMVANRVAASTSLTGVTVGSGTRPDGTAETIYCPYSPAYDDSARVTVRYTFKFVTPISAIAALVRSNVNSSDMAMSSTAEVSCTGG